MAPRIGGGYCCSLLAKRLAGVEERRQLGIRGAARLRRQLEFRPTGPTLHAAEARRDDGDPHLAGEPRIDGRAEDDVRLVGRRITKEYSRLVHLDEREI